MDELIRKTHILKVRNVGFNIYGLDKEKDKDSLTVKRIQQMTHPDDLDRVLQNGIIALKEGKLKPIDYRIIRPDKTERWVHGESELEMDFNHKKLTGMIGIVQDITERKKAEEKLKHSQEELQKLAEHMQFATEQERGLIASELHDEIGQALVCLKLDIAMIIHKMSEEKIEIPIQFQNMEKLLDDSIQKLGKIYSDLRPSLLEHFGIGGAMRQYVSDFQKQSGTKCTLYQNPEEIILEENRSIALYRIFQGALNNIKWHSQATKANIRLVEKGPNLKLTIKDNGKGIEEEQIKSSDSFGLIGMRERARYLGGELKIKGIPDKGTTVMLEIPIKKIQ